nr:hypothetical protein [Tanacetum cinerariifolium]
MKPRRKVTEVPQPSDPIEHVVDEAINKEMNDSLEKAAITSTSLDAEQDKVNVHNDEDVFGVNDLDGDEMIVESVDGAEQAKEVIDDITLAKALMEIKCAKPKANNITSRKAKELTDAKKAKLFMQFLKKIRKFFAAKRAEEKRNKPPKRAQQRSIMTKLVLKSSKKACAKVKEDDGDDVTIDATPLSFKEDLEVLWRLVKARFKKIHSVDYMDNLLLHNLKTMFEHHIEDNAWKNQQGLVKVKNQKLYDSCGVHCVTLESIPIYMLVEKMYPLTNHTLHQMFNDVNFELIMSVKWHLSFLDWSRNSLRKDMYLNYALWEVIKNGNGEVQMTKDKDGNEVEVPPVTARQILARTRERKAKSTLLMAIPDEHLARFHGIKDVKTLWAAIKTRFGDDSIYKFKISETVTSLSKDVKDIPETSTAFVENPIEVRTSALLIQEWDTDSDNDSVSRPKHITAKINFVKADRMAKKSVFPNDVGKRIGHRENRPVWNNVQRINHQNEFAPITVFTRSGRIPVSATKPKAASSTCAAKPVNTVGPKQSVNSSNSRSSFHRSHSPKRRSFYNATAHSRRNSTERVNTVGSKAVSVVKGNGDTTVKASASCVWLPRVNEIDQISKDNRLLVTKPHNKTLYELLNGRSPRLYFMRPFGYFVTILNTLDPLGKFEGKADEGFLVGYSVTSKAFRVFNTKTRKVEENLHVRFLKNKPNVAKTGPNWLFDIDSLTNSMNYIQVSAGNQTDKNAGPQDTNNNACTQDNVDAGNEVFDQHHIVLPLWSFISYTYKSLDDKAGDDKPKDDTSLKNVMKQSIRKTNPIEINPVNATSTSGTFSACRPLSSHPDAFILDDTLLHVDQDDSQIPDLEDTAELSSIGIFTNAYDDDLDTFTSPAIGTKWVYRNKKDERGIVVRNKARLVAHRHRQEEGIDYDEVFALVARIEAIRIFLAFTSFVRFIVYQMDVKQSEEIIFISQDKYVAEILKKFDFSFMRTTSTPIESQKPLVKEEEAADVDVYLYRSMTRSLMYLTASRPDIIFAICACSRFQVTLKLSHLHAMKRIFRFQVTLKLSHLHAVKRIFRYLKGQPNLGFWYPRYSPFELEAYSDSDYVGVNLNRKSTTGDKTEGNIKFHQIVDFLTSSSIHHALSGEGSCSGPECQETMGVGSREDKMEYAIELTDLVPQTPYDSPILGGHTPRSDKGSMTLNKLTNLCTTLSHKVLDLEKVKTAQAKEIASLKKKVTKLEQRQSLRISGLHPFRASTSRRHSLGRRNVSKQGRKNLMSQQKVQDIDDLVDEEVIFKDNGSGEKGSSTAKTVSTARPEVNTVEPKTPPTTTTFLMMKMSPLLIPWKERERQEEASKDAQAGLYDELAKERAEAIRSKPPTKTQLRNLMMTYLKHTSRFTHAQLKSKRFEKIQKLYTKEQKWVNDFVPIGFEEDEKRVKSRKKRAAGLSLKQNSPKKQKVNDQESVNSDKELKKCLMVVPDDDKAINYKTLDVKVKLLSVSLKSSRIDDEVIQDQRQRDDNDLQDERQDQAKEEEVEPRRIKRAIIEKLFGSDFVSFMVENKPTFYPEAVTFSEWLNGKKPFKVK